MMNPLVVRLTCLLMSHYLAEKFCEWFAGTEVYGKYFSYWEGRIDVLKMVIWIGLFIGMY